MLSQLNANSEAIENRVRRERVARASWCLCACFVDLSRVRRFINLGCGSYGSMADEETQEHRFLFRVRNARGKATKVERLHPHTQHTLVCMYV